MAIGWVLELQSSSLLWLTTGLDPEYTPRQAFLKFYKILSHSKFCFMPRRKEVLPLLLEVS